jgi:hypothetical protein
MGTGMVKNWRSHGIRVLGELSVIVLGVIVALQVEGLRDTRDEQSREREAMVALSSDLEETRTRLENDMARQGRSIRAQRRLLAFADGERPLPASDSLGLLISRAIIFQRLEPVRGTYDALVGSGELRLIRSDSVRASLAALFGLMGDGFEDEGLSTLLRTEMLMAVSETAPLLKVSGSEFRAVVGRPPNDDDAPYEALLNNATYISALMSVAATEAFQMSYFRRLREELGVTITLLERGLSDSE